MKTRDQIAQSLAACGYIADAELATAVALMQMLKQDFDLFSPGGVPLRAADGSVIIEKAAVPAPLDPDRFAKLRGIADAGLSTDEIMALMRGKP